MDHKNELVLVTGASGFIGTHCVQQLVEQGYRVRGTVRSLSNKTKVDPVRALDTKGLLELVEADLHDAKTWKKAVKGCDYVLHVASPFPIVADEKCIQTAIEGTLNVLQAVADTEGVVRKVVLTSSCAAINGVGSSAPKPITACYSKNCSHLRVDHERRRRNFQMTSNSGMAYSLGPFLCAVKGHAAEKMFDESTWTNVEDPKVDCYAKSKTLAEKAAWEFVNGLPPSKRFALTVINPTLVFGPAYITEQGASISLMRRFMNCEMPACPPLNMAVVDVRDVARAHIAALQRPQSDNKRILVTNTPSMWFLDIARILSKEFKGQGYWIPCLQAPYFVVWLYSFFDAEAAASLPRLCQKVMFDNTRAKELLGMEFRDNEEAVVQMAHSLIKLGIIKKPRIRCIFS